MKKCTKCQAELLINSAFCHVCGSRVSESIDNCEEIQLSSTATPPPEKSSLVEVIGWGKNPNETKLSQNRSVSSFYNKWRIDCPRESCGEISHNDAYKCRNCEGPFLYKVEQRYEYKKLGDYVGATGWNRVVHRVELCCVNQNCTRPTLGWSCKECNSDVPSSGVSYWGEDISVQWSRGILIYLFGGSTPTIIRGDKVGWFYFQCEDKHKPSLSGPE